MQAAILDYACEHSVKEVGHAGLIHAQDLVLQIEEVMELTGAKDIHHADRELDHLHSLDLIHGGLDSYAPLAHLTPTALALHLYVRAKGFNGSPVEFFGLLEDE